MGGWGVWADGWTIGGQRAEGRVGEGIVRICLVWRCQGSVPRTACHLVALSLALASAIDWWFVGMSVNSTRRYVCHICAMR
jgi:hypothetical protein